VAPDIKDGLKRKEFKYSDLNITIGKGKYGPVSLIMVEEQLFALKKIAKSSIDNPKRVQHVYTERNILRSVQSDFIVQLKDTFTDE
jgi:serine/threonine protein kinase